ncbi:hypothetical protein M6B38_301360 [Iris pallida]|uniref:Uncharacterized protein n=1 Tax=Iris pallida TaxID=29817 RepID=A0AAX6HPF5_IRIPA|nr:hypothetical protein M6B38_301360 [Iris pallida]
MLVPFQPIIRTHNRSATRIIGPQTSLLTTNVLC